MKQTYTPIVYVENWLDNNVYIKRDDLLPFSFGGNKVRITQEFFEDMKKGGYDCIIGYGNARSNLSRAIANQSAKEHVECHIISPSDDDGTRIDTSNSNIVKLCNAKFHYCKKSDVASTVEVVIDECKKSGYNPYYIYGDKTGKGNEVTPLRAYIKVYEEIKEQSQMDFDYIFLATGTGMTQGGLLIGKQLHEGKEKIIGISVARDKETEENVLRKMIDAYNEQENLKDNYIDHIHIEDKYLCGGYGKYNEKLKDLVGKIMINYGIPLDLTYTGKAYYGMRQYLQENNIKDKNILFIHTGGTPLFFDNLAKVIES